MSGHQDPSEVWEGVAPAWDANVDYVNTITARATDEVVSSLAIAPGDRVVELAGGPGTLGERWSGLVGADGAVLVSDGAPAMVEAAARRLAPFANVRTAVLDLTRIDLPDDAADVAVCRFGLMFVTDPATTLTDVHRILAPGVRLGLMTWAGPEHNPWVANVGRAAMAHGVITGGPPVGPGELFSLTDPERLAALARDAGFDPVTVTEAPVAFPAPDVETHVEMVQKLAGPLAAAFASATSEQLAAVRSSVAESATPFSTDNGYEFPGRALLLTASKT